MDRKQAMVTHGGRCTHVADSYAVALSQALAHAEMTATPQERQAMVRSFLKKEDVWHNNGGDPVFFTGSWG